jgi:glycosyltransferase involved in cell wall biosynthesis
MPLFSIVVAAYNHEQFVRQQVESILAQTFQDFEVVAVDDGSSDRTAEILEEYVPRIRVIRQENRGVADARMRGIRETTGELVCFVDSDDCLEPRRLEWQAAAFQASPEIGLVYGDARIIDLNGNELGRFSELYRPHDGDVAFELFRRYCFVPAISATFRRGFLEQTGGFWGPGPLCDYLKWIELAMVSKVVRLPLVLGSWRRHPESVSYSANREKLYLEVVASLEQLRAKWPEFAARTGFASLARYAQAYVLIGFSAARNGDASKARSYFWRALSSCPWSVHAWGGLFLSLPPLSFFGRTIFSSLHRLLFPWE